MQGRHWIASRGIRWFYLLSVLLALGLVRPAVGVQSATPVPPRAPDRTPPQPGALNAVADDVFWNNTGLVAGVNDTVRALKFADGDVFIGGNFTAAGGVPASRVAKWDGERWSALGAGIGGSAPTVAAIDVSDNFVYVVGEFTSAGGVATAGAARWSRATGVWEALATSKTGAFESVAVIERVGGDDVYVGGTFTQVNGVSASRIAKFRNGSWSALGGGIAGGTAPTVRSISINPSNVNQLAVGGLFSTAGGSTANNVALWDGSAWSALGSGASNGVSSRVNVVSMRGMTMVLVGGSFGAAGTTGSVGGLARWSGGNDWEPLAGRGVSGGEVLGLLETGPDELYVAGTFTSVLNDVGTGAGSAFLSRFDGNIWHATNQRVGASVFALDRAGGGSNDFFLGGAFSLIGGAAGLRANAVAFVDTAESTLGPQESFFALGGGPQGSNDTIHAMLRSSTTVYVGGVFDRVSQLFVQNIALFDTTTRSWRPLGAAGEIQGANGRVRAMALNGATLIAVGDFTAVGNFSPFSSDPGLTPAAGVAAYNGTSWQALATSINGDVHAVTVHNGAIVVGGEFTEIDGVPVNHIASWNGSSWSPVSGTQGFGTDGPVFSLASSGASLYVGGLFTQAGGVSANNIAAWSTTWRALAGGTNGKVGALRLLGSGLVAVGGRFLAADGNTAARNIALVSSSGVWQALGTGVRDEVRAIQERGADLYVGGLFTQVNGLATSANNLGRWNGVTWQPLASGVQSGGGVNAMVLQGDRLFVGGDFERAGDKPAYLFGEWNQPEVDLAVRPGDSPDPVVVGNALTYATRVYNLGNLPAANTVITQTIAPSFVLNNFSTSQGSCAMQDATTVRCALGTLGDGALVLVQLFLTPTQAGTFSSSLAVRSAADEALVDNNARTFSTQVTPPGNPVPTITSLSPSSFVRQPFSFPPPPAVRITVSGAGFVPTSKVRIDGADATTTFISNNRLEFTKASTSSTGSYDITVFNPTPGGGTSNAETLRVTTGLVGVSSVVPDAGGVDVGLQTTFVVSWTHTTDQWRVIDHMDLCLVDANGVGLWLRFTEGLSGTFSLLDADGNAVGVAEAGAPEVLSNDIAELDIVQSSFAGSGPTGFSMRASFTVRFTEAARGRRYNIELYATDDKGGVQGPDIFGTYAIGFTRSYLPLLMS